MTMSNMWGHVVCATGIWVIFGMALFYEHAGRSGGDRWAVHCIRKDRPAGPHLLASMCRIPHLIVGRLTFRAAPAALSLPRTPASIARACGYALCRNPLNAHQTAAPWAKIAMVAGAQRLLFGTLICHRSGATAAWLSAATPDRSDAAQRAAVVAIGTACQRLKIVPLVVATTHLPPRRTIASTRPAPGTASPGDTVINPSGPSKIAVPSTTSHTDQFPTRGRSPASDERCAWSSDGEDRALCAGAGVLLRASLV